MTLSANSCMALRRSVTDRAVDLKDMRYYSRLFSGHDNLGNACLCQIGS
jgi:hypothetical protein